MVYGQKEIAEKIADSDAEHTINLKENYPTLCHATQSTNLFMRKPCTP
jgi:hypothetical protein